METQKNLLEAGLLKNKQFNNCKLATKHNDFFDNMTFTFLTKKQYALCAITDSHNVDNLYVVKFTITLSITITD